MEAGATAVTASGCSPLIKVVVIIVAGVVGTGLITGLSVGLLANTIKTPQVKNTTDTTTSAASSAPSSSTTTEHAYETTSQAEVTGTTSKVVTTGTTLQSGITGTTLDGEDTGTTLIYEGTTLQIGETGTTLQDGETGTTLKDFVTRTTLQIGVTETTLEGGETETTLEGGETETTLEVGETETTLEGGETDTTVQTVVTTAQFITGVSLTILTTKATEVTSQTSVSNNPVTSQTGPNAITSTVMFPTTSANAVITTTEYISTTPKVTCPTDFTRTIIMMKYSSADSFPLFYRGGLGDNRRNEGGGQVVSINHPTDPLGTSSAFTQYYNWADGDNFLEWGGSESGQSNDARGTPAAKTTNVEGEVNYYIQNDFGEDYWVTDMCMRCSDCYLGSWFEFKSYRFTGGDEWETDVNQPRVCDGSVGESTPFTSNNHVGICGKVNIYERGSASCTINHL